MNLRPLNNVMLDLETMGNGSNAAIVAIGAVFFEPFSGAIGAEFYCEIKLTSAVHYGEMDASTVEWWLQQSNEAQALFNKENQSNRLTLKDALAEFSEWMNEGAEFKSRTVWGNGAGFDNVILGNAYKAARLRQPWPFYGDRDVRTMVDLGRQLRGENPKRDLPFDGIQHNAVDDAKHQAKYVSAIWQALSKKI